MRQQTPETSHRNRHETRTFTGISGLSVDMLHVASKVSPVGLGPVSRSESRHFRGPAERSGSPTGCESREFATETATHKEEPKEKRFTKYRRRRPGIRAPKRQSTVCPRARVLAARAVERALNKGVLVRPARVALRITRRVLA